jgi:uncharacterized protein
MTATTLRTVLWRPVGAAGAQHCTLRRLAKGFRLDGHVLNSVEGIPLHVQYIVDCDLAWRTRVVTISQSYGTAGSTLRFDVVNKRWWTAEGAEMAALHWLIDVDLSVTPATNTLPIRRLALDVGQKCDVTAAWVRFPALTVEPLLQTYERVATNVYRYTSNGGSFSALLEVDDLGLVVRYERIWERVAVG